MIYDAKTYYTLEPFSQLAAGWKNSCQQSASNCTCLWQLNHSSCALTMTWHIYRCSIGFSLRFLFKCHNNLLHLHWEDDVSMFLGSVRLWWKPLGQWWLVIGRLNFSGLTQPFHWQRSAIRERTEKNLWPQEMSVFDCTVFFFSLSILFLIFDICVCLYIYIHTFLLATVCLGQFVWVWSW